MTSPLSTAVTRAILRFCEDISTPRSLAAHMLIKAGEWDQVSLLRSDPKQYDCAEAYWRDASISALLKKCEDLPTTFDRKAKAVENFWLGEQSCFRANRRLYPLVDSLRYSAEATGALEDFCLRVRKIISDILGPVPLTIGGRFGPGATYGDRGRLTTVPDKMSTRPTLTHDAWPWLVPWSGTLWASACSKYMRDPLFVRGNRFTTVPKDNTKHRGICVEPSLNLFYQLGVGKSIRSRLKSAGIDLQNGQELHRRLACNASLDGSLCTLDLKNASDSVSRRLVELFLPPKWFELLDDLRSKTTVIGGKTILLEKFSSMGNGFTFELETLLFYAIAQTCVPHGIPGETVSVYGDDIIVPTESSKDVIRALEFFGLTVNEEKSFTSGHFRESCGGDYFKGVDVRPHFLKESPCEPQQLISFANGVRRMGLNNPNATSRHRALHRLRLGLISDLPMAIRRCRGPQDLGDIVIHDVEDLWQHRWRSSIRYIRCYRPARFERIAWEHWSDDVVLATACYMPINEPGGAIVPKGLSPRNSVQGYKLGWVPFS